VRRAAERGEVLLNGEPAGLSVTLKLGDALQLLVNPESMTRERREGVTLLLREEGLALASKPSGLPFDESRHGGPSTVASLQELCGGRRPRLLHRLDKDTSGMVVAALDKDTAEQLTGEFAAERAQIEYLAVVRGPLPGDEGEVDLPLGKGNRSSATLRPDPRHGREAVTAWSVEERLSGFTILRLRPRRGGRSHQVRAHLAALGNPALCDASYHEDDRLLLSQLKLHYRPKRGRPERPVLARPALHAQRFTWERPWGEDLSVEAPLPEDLTVLLAQLRRLRPLA
jgi:23S rRNA-/tRNA-specific pseudouridylate synthase